MTLDEQEINLLLDELGLAEKYESSPNSSRRWKPLARRATAALLELKGELEQERKLVSVLKADIALWSAKFHSADEHVNRLSEQLQSVGQEPRGRASYSTAFNGDRGRTHAKSRERGTSRPGGMRRRSSSGGLNVRFRDLDTGSSHATDDSRRASVGANVGRERPSRGYHITAEELRRRAEADKNAQFIAQKKEEFREERDRLSKRFDKKERKASNVHFDPFNRFRMPQTPPHTGTPHPPPPPPPPPPPHPGMMHHIPSPGDPLAHPELMTPRQDALPPELYDFILRGGHDVFGRQRRS